MELLDIYRGFGHQTRLRILLLLAQRSLCVHHLQQILDASQVEISRQLAFLKSCKLVQVEKLRNWRVYALPAEQSLELQLHLKCLQECVRQTDPFTGDLERLKAIRRGPMQRTKRIRIKPIETLPEEPLVVEEEPFSLESHLL